jgi:hypothetical protein
VFQEDLPAPTTGRRRCILLVFPDRSGQILMPDVVRWLPSPASYGTTRSASLSSYLQNKGGVRVSGILLISTVLDFQTIHVGPGNDVPYSLFLPTYTAAAWHHKKLDKAWAGDLPTALEESQHFASGAYLCALPTFSLRGPFDAG